MRIYDYFNPIFISYDDSYNRFRAKPHSKHWEFTVNEHGFKDIEFTEKQDNVYRILGIGDSFAFGVVPYQHNYLTLLETRLQQEGLSVEVLNMGIPSIGPEDYVSLLVREGLALDPDMVLVSFFIGNDFTDNSKDPEERKWYSYSYVTSLLRYAFVILPYYEGWVHEKSGTPYCDDCPKHELAFYLDLERKRSFLYGQQPARFTKLLGYAVNYLSQIQDICRKKDIALAVVMLPDEIQINPSLRQQVLATYPDELRADVWDNTMPNERLGACLDSLGIQYLDLYRAFVEQAKNRPLYIPRNSHWNIAGNQLAAQSIQDHIRRYVP